MVWRRGYWGFPILLMTLAACSDGRDPLAPLFMVVGPPASLAASAVSYYQISLSWVDNATNESGFEVHRSTTGPGGSFSLLTTLAAGATSYGNGGLSQATQYCYKVRAFRTTGRKNTYSDFSNVACATTLPAPVPAGASGVNAVPQSGYAINVTWSDNSSDETGFRVERAPSATGPWTSIATLYANAAALFDYQVSLEQLECYRVFAFNGYGDAAASNVACTAVPRTPTNLAANVANGAVDLTWTDNSSVESGVEVQRAAAGGSYSVIANVPANAISYHDATISPDVAYTYFVRATRDGGTSGSSNVVQVLIVTAPPAAPGPVGVVPSGSSAVTVYWTANSSNQAGFRVERSTDGQVSWIAVGTAGQSDGSLPDWGLVSEQPVCYRVIAFNQIGDSPASIPGCTTPPAGPTNLTATLLSDGTTQLAWMDNSNVEDGYQVWVDDGYGDESIIASLDPNATSFNDGGYYNGFLFAVVALKDGGYSDFSDWVYATAPAAPSGMRVRQPSAPPKRLPVIPRQRKVRGVTP